jgi:hypothetical protein
MFMTPVKKDKESEIRTVPKISYMHALISFYSLPDAAKNVVMLTFSPSKVAPLHFERNVTVACRPRISVANQFQLPFRFQLQLQIQFDCSVVPQQIHTILVISASEKMHTCLPSSVFYKDTTGIYNFSRILNVTQLKI